MLVVMAVITIARCANETQDRVLEHLRGCAFCAAHPERIVHMARIMAQDEERDSVPCGMSRSEKDAQAGKKSKSAALKQRETDVLGPKLDEVKQPYEEWMATHRVEPEMPADAEAGVGGAAAQSFKAGELAVANVESVLGTEDRLPASAAGTSGVRKEGT